jgi:hypothetical protein
LAAAVAVGQGWKQIGELGLAFGLSSLTYTLANERFATKDLSDRPSFCLATTITPARPTVTTSLQFRDTLAELGAPHPHRAQIAPPERVA